MGLKFRNIYVAAGTTILLVIAIFLANKSIFLTVRKPMVVISSGTFQSGDVLYSILSGMNFTNSDISAVINSLNQKHSVRRLNPGQLYEIHHSTFGTIFQFNYWHSSVKYFCVRKSTTGIFYCEEQFVPSTKTTATVEGTINTTLYDAMIEKGVSLEIIMTLADMFQWQIDFYNDPRVGDTFKVVYEQYKYENDFIKNGEILAARYNGKSTGEVTGVFFESSDGKISGHYAPDGGSLRKIFLKAPLNFRRISSYFSHKRFHPILRYYRPHKGIDYAAPHGTPIVSIGDGVVTFRGWKGQNGKLVVIKHNATYTSSYAHLSSFAPGIKTGKRVKQGEFVGRVGSTGLSTGPHLDFRIKKNGAFVNFLKLRFPPSESVPRKYQDEFTQKKDELLKILENNDQKIS
ncbi:MAG: peptidoglycan DD-metalloendopeptidase family protein [Elusimicrobiota bacterium]